MANNTTTSPIKPTKSKLDEEKSTKPKRNKSPGLRVMGKRIYDPKNGKTCHQCRQKTLDVCVGCTNEMENKKKCTLNVCQACLHNRYGENAEEAAKLEDWKCPRCRDICNCSFCMKKKGYGPTGILARTAKDGGYASVSNLLQFNGRVTNGGARKRQRASEKETSDEPIKEVDGQSESTHEVDGTSEEEKNIIEDTSEDDDVEINLPQGTELTNLAGIDMPSGDTGHALQFLEFCETFGEVLDLQKGQPEILLRELTRAQRGNEPMIVQFHIRLISLIEEDMGKKYRGKSWVEDFKKCIAESDCLSKEGLVECFNLQPNGYDELSFSKKLRLLNFLCDEALGTVKLRLWVDERNVEEKKKMKEKVIANREKEKNTKKKVQVEVAKAIISRNGIPLSISEHKDLVSKIKAETAQTLANSLEMRDVRRESYVIRSEPVHLDRNGCKLWKLRSHFDKIGILLQDSCYGDTSCADEKWFAYSDCEKALVDDYMTNSRNFRE